MTDSPARAPLEDVMVAMDVVDTLRHREKLVARELNTEGRREELIRRLREIYAAQGIDVTDAMLEEGVRALEEDRFTYTPPEPSLSTRLARIYVSRSGWGKPVLAFLLLCLIGWAVHYYIEVRPEAQARAQLPDRLDKTFAEIVVAADDEDATARAQSLLQSARAALDNDKLDAARDAHGEMELLLARLKNAYDVRIVSRPDELSGAWRIPDINSSARNFYLIVEAVDQAGNILSMPITSEEDGKTRSVRKWGLRVDEQTFQAVAADKRDDGIIQRNIVGAKQRGKQQPEYRISTTGGAITEW